MITVEQLKEALDGSDLQVTHYSGRCMYGHCNTIEYMGLSNQPQYPNQENSK
jgi:hypothetical protein